MAIPDWRGVYPAVTTQFGSDERLDTAATSRHLEVLISAGVHGLIMLGTVGENCSLEPPEKLEVIRTAARVAADRVPVVAGVAEYTTAQACRFAGQAADDGATGLMVLPAMVYKSDPQETIVHFRTIARSTHLPILCYNNPVSYGVDLTPAMFAELASERNLTAIKESSDDARRITDLIDVTGARYTIMSGVDDLVLESVLLGSVGWVSGLVNAFPTEAMDLWKLAVAGKFQEAMPLYRWFMPLLHLDTRVKLVQCIKLAMAETGLGSEYTRAPRLTLDGRERDEVLAIIRKAISCRPVLPNE